MVQNIVLGGWDGHKIMLSEMDVAPKPVSGLDWDGKKPLGRAMLRVCLVIKITQILL